MSSGSEPVTGVPPQAGPEATGQRRRRRPPLFVIIWVAVGVVIVAAVIAIDATSHRLKAVAAPPPKPAPALSLPSLRDPAQQVSLTAYQGRPLIVNFFASWCGPCQQETPLLARFYRAEHGKVVIIGVDADDNATAARKFMTAKGVAYPVGYESTPALSDAYGVSEIGIPETFFLNAKHRIVKHVIGGVTAKDLASGVTLMDRTT
jgi:cytochrome c biogenesis protein CcmG/thiol:disulfide interchange protein DsbE